MKPSKIIFNQPLLRIAPKTPDSSLGKAYLRAKKELYKTEVELQRSKIIVLDSKGNLVKLKLQQEH